MAAAKPPQYDPVKTVEGMFNGSVTRIAYAIKDPANYAQSTKAVLAETAKKFQDALDDCEIQILEAKWYLEHQLAVNKARREEKARQESAAAHAKRKREETTEDEQSKPVEKKEGGDNANAQKRVKTAEAEPQASTQTQQPSKSPLQPQPAVPPGEPAEQPAAQEAEKKPAHLQQKEKPSKPNNKQPPESTTATTTSQASTGTGPPSKPPHNRPQSIQIPPNNLAHTTTTTTADELPKDTPQDNTSAIGNDDFNFVSMFGEPSGGDNMDGSGNELNFDLNGLDGANNMNMNIQDASLNSLLPGLESYANQAGDDSSFNMAGSGTGTADVNQGSGAGTDSGGATTANNNNAQQQQINISDFSLPALGPNEFDDLLNSNDMNFDEAINLNDDGTMNMESMDLDFDSMFK
ncbi:hypothetical protein ABEF93_002614 [Exophiala dermatitidis]